MWSMYEERNLRRALAASVETHSGEQAKRAAEQIAGAGPAKKPKRPALRSAAARELHGQGWTIIPSSAFNMLEAYREFINEKLSGEKEVVFNHKVLEAGAVNDKLRLQVALDGDVGAQILAVLWQELTRADVVSDDHNANALVALLSEAGCARQPCHTDLDPDLLTKCTNDTMPLLILVALDKDTSLQIWPMDCDEPFELPLPQYSALVFRADLRHAGSAYERSNV